MHWHYCVSGLTWACEFDEQASKQLVLSVRWSSRVKVETNDCVSFYDHHQLSTSSSTISESHAVTNDVIEGTSHAEDW